MINCAEAKPGNNDNRYIPALYEIAKKETFTDGDQNTTRAFNDKDIVAFKEPLKGPVDHVNVDDDIFQFCGRFRGERGLECIGVDFVKGIGRSRGLFQK